MNETQKAKSGWRIVRRLLIALAVLATLIAVFYTEEDWRGKRAWENTKRELEAKGETLDWDKYIPPPVPDESNFFAAPKMQEWFTGRGERELGKHLYSANENLTTSFGEKRLINSAKVAESYLKWSDRFEPDFDLIREALKRPDARMDGNYSVPYEIPIPNFLTIRAVAQTLAQRAHCYILLNQPDHALDELTLMHDLREMMQSPPSGKPITLVAAMINVAVMGLYASEVEEGFQKNVWQEPQLVALQKQMSDTDVMPWVLEAFESEPAATTHTLENTSTAKLKEWFQVSDGKSSGGKISIWQKIRNLKWILIPRGWIYQNMATSARLVYKQTENFDSANDLIRPKKFEDLNHELNTIAKPYKFLTAEAIPNFTKAWQTTAHNQTMVNEAQIACALERYHLAHGEYPETLDALTPQFIEKIPHDIIGGEPLVYRPTMNGNFLLYSIGWNEKDDDGKDGGTDFTRADWVWKN